jgi:hypothetical protein
MFRKTSPFAWIVISTGMSGTIFDKLGPWPPLCLAVVLFLFGWRAGTRVDASWDSALNNYDQTFERD